MRVARWQQMLQGKPVGNCQVSRERRRECGVLTVKGKGSHGEGLARLSWETVTRQASSKGFCPRREFTDP